MPDRLEEVTLSIGSERWEQWSSIEIHRVLDSLSNVRFTAPFEPDSARFRRTFRPLTFPSVTLEVGGALVFSGRLATVSPSASPSERSVACEASSAPAVLDECTMPASAYPLELNNLGLRRIAETLLEPFGIPVVFDGLEGAPFHRLAMDPDARPMTFLADRAKERALIVSDTADGSLRFFSTPPVGAPRVRFEEGTPPLVSVAPSFAPQEFYSEVTALAAARAGRVGAGHTEQNPHLRAPLRPLAYRLENTDDTDAAAAARAKVARMIGNAATWTVSVPTWRDPSARLWEPGTMVSLLAPSAMVYRETDLLIREVTLVQEPDSTSATLGLVLPGAFAGEVPEVLPWD